MYSCMILAIKNLKSAAFAFNDLNAGERGFESIRIAAISLYMMNLHDYIVMWAIPARLAIGLRIAIAVFSVTFFQPDEYFQALEPAHNLVFGYGHLTWEWRTRPPIRSVFFPILFVPVYWVLKVLDLDETNLLVWI